MPPKRKLTKKPTSWRMKKKQKYANKTLLVKPLSSERKWFQIGFAPKDMFCGESYGINPFYWVAQGVQQDQRIGLTLEDVNIYVDINYFHIGSTNASVNKSLNSSYRAILFGNPQQWHQAVTNVFEPNTAGVGTVIPNTQVYLDSGLDRTTHSYLNKDYNKIYHDSGQKLVNQPWATTYNNGPDGYVSKYRFKVKLGDLRFQANGNQSYLRDDNVYLWVTSTFMGQNGPANTDFSGKFTCNMLVTYKDS